jgi:ABC transporter substrate binding protein (PQQ-dependent alcohol dehydrogenase system)
MMRLPLTPLLLGLLVAHLFNPHATAKPNARPSPAKNNSQPAVNTETQRIGYLGQQPATPPVQPFFDPIITDAGIQGARLGITDDNTTGRFTRQNFILTERVLAPDQDIGTAFRQLIADGHHHILVNLPASALGSLTLLAESQSALIYDIASRDDALRGEDCRANVLHMLPNRAMRADALAQYLAKKRWKKWLLVRGPDQADALYAEALRRSARKFGSKIVADKLWEHHFDERRTPESEIPVFTQGDDYDVVVVADESGLFGDFLPYRTWEARPVAGTAGLIPTSWHPTLEAWGALQLQNRFREQTTRWMTEIDYGAWLAVRAIGEAATRSHSAQFDHVKAYLLGKDFSLAGFKGVPLSFRPWDHQLRQPVLLASDRSLVATAPIEGYLHPQNELDTLGFDAAESHCRF